MAAQLSGVSSAVLTHGVTAQLSGVTETVLVLPKDLLYNGH